MFALKRFTTVRNTTATSRFPHAAATTQLGLKSDDVIWTPLGLTHSAGYEI